MAINIAVEKDSFKKEFNYPCLAINANDVVVRFSKHGYGTALTEGIIVSDEGRILDVKPFGLVSCVDMRCFTLFLGSITIANDF